MARGGTRLEFKEAAVELVDREHGLDALAEGLAEHSLGLHAHTLNAVHDDEGTVGDAEGGSHFGREIDVPGGVHDVEQVGVAVAFACDRGGGEKPTQKIIYL